jgi:fermentation-respiration switch protein FrsA (DUF1100 family)
MVRFLWLTFSFGIAISVHIAYVLVVKVSSTRLLTFVRSGAIAAVVAIGFWTFILMIFEEQFIYFPSPHDEREYRGARELVRAQDYWFVAEDGVKLHGWFVPAHDPVGTLVISHGNAGNISHRGELLRRLQQAGFNSFIYDYRGYGKSEGKPHEDGVYRDGRAAFDLAASIGGVDDLPIILFGTSLGGAVAVDVALHRRASGLIVEATFPSARAVAKVLYPFLPVQFLMRSEFSSIEKIRKITIPLLVIHGERDEIIPLELGRELYEAANQPKTLYSIPEAGHNDTFLAGGEAYLKRIRDFASTLKLQSVLSGGKKK